MSTDTRERLPAYLIQALVIGLLGWIAYTTQELSVRMARFEQGAISSEARDQVTNREILDLRTRVTTCEIELAKLRR